MPRDHVATGDEADELLRTLRDSTYVLRSPLQASDVGDLWTVVAWRKCYLENKAKKAADRRRRVVPAAVQAFLAGGYSTVGEGRNDDESRVHFKAVSAGGRRGRKRKSGGHTVVVGSSGTVVLRVCDIIYLSYVTNSLRLCSRSTMRQVGSICLCV